MGKRVSLHIEDRMLKDLILFTDEKSQSRAILKAIESFMDSERRARIEELRHMLGTIDLVDNWYELRHGHLKEGQT